MSYKNEPINWAALSLAVLTGLWLLAILAGYMGLGVLVGNMLGGDNAIPYWVFGWMLWGAIGAAPMIVYTEVNK